VKVYADTSWWFALKCRRDTHHVAATSLFDQHLGTEVLWTPWHRVEVFNSLRQAERAGLVPDGQSRRMIRLLEQEVRLGYWPHVEFDWTDAVRTACELGAGHSLRFLVRAMDLFHVAIALEVAADGFLSFDSDQNVLAEAAGLPLVTRSTRAKPS
jgi:predicted nucleic acid-binding protein